jgi:site-specific DNA recombinase
MSVSPARWRGAAAQNRPGCWRRWRIPAVALRPSPRYTGRQVWNKQSTSEALIDPHDVAQGVRKVRRNNPMRDWIYSREAAHPAIVTVQDFEMAQRTPTVIGTPRTYVLRGLVRCGVCGRSMEGCWTNNRPNYRCRHRPVPGTTRTGTRAQAGETPSIPASVFVREETIAAHLGALLIRAVADADGSTDLDIVKVPGDLPAQARLCRAMGLSLTYQPVAQTLITSGNLGEIVIRLR